jgi:hypothetical protein
MTMAGQNESWTPLSTETVGGVTVYSSSFSKIADSGAKNFKLVATISKGDVVTVEEAPCSQCAHEQTLTVPNATYSAGDVVSQGVGNSAATGIVKTTVTGTSVVVTVTSGTFDTTNNGGDVTIDGTVRSCSNVSQGSQSAGVCKKDDDKVCSAAESDGTCATGKTKCTQSITLPKNELKFSIIIDSWDFQNANNSLTYGLELTYSGGTAQPTSQDGGDKKTLTTPGGAKIVLDTKATIVGGNTAPQEVDVTVSTGEQGGKYLIDFVFPNFGSRALYYDPSMAVASTVNEAAATSAGNNVGPMHVQAVLLGIVMLAQAAVH